MMGGMEHTQSPRSAAQPVDARRLAALAALLAEPTRAAFCLALLDGRAWTAGELARQAGVARSTATEQLNALVDGGLLAEARQGRHRYLQLADPAAAELVELLAERADPAAPASPAPGTLSGDSRRRALARARTCYDHLAGTLGVAIMDAMTERGLLDWTRGLALTPTGEAWLAELGVPSPPGPPAPAAPPCARASTGRSAARTWPARWVPRSAATHSTPAGCSASEPPGPCGSPLTAPQHSSSTWDLPFPERPVRAKTRCPRPRRLAG